MNAKNILNFLAELQANNNRNWFKQNEDRYLQAKEDFETFVNNMISEIQKFDKDIGTPVAKDCIFRLFRDVRFSKNKDPYKTNFGAFIANGGRKSHSAGYYMHIQPGHSFIGGGIYMPEPKILLSIRKEIFKHTNPFKKIIAEKTFQKYFGEIHGEKLKLPPKGFPKEFEDIELLKHKHYTVLHPVKDHFWISKNAISKTTEIFKIQYPFNRFLNKAL